MQAAGQGFLIYMSQFLEETVRKYFLFLDFPFQEEGSHHRDISQRQNQGADDTEYQCLGHRCKIFAFDAGQCQYREEDNQDNQYRKSGRTCHTGSSLFHLCIHFFFRQRTSTELAAIDMGQYPLQDNDGTVYDDTEVDGS